MGRDMPFHVTLGALEFFLQRLNDGLDTLAGHAMAGGEPLALGD